MVTDVHGDGLGLREGLGLDSKPQLRDMGIAVRSVSGTNMFSSLQIYQMTSHGTLGSNSLVFKGINFH